MDSVLRRLCTPWAEINRREIDLCFQQDGDGLLLNLVNMRQGCHALNMPVFEEIPTVQDVEVRLHRTYSEVSMPLGEDFTWKICGNQTVIRLPELHIHSMIRLK